MTSSSTLRSALACALGAALAWPSGPALAAPNPVLDHTAFDVLAFDGAFVSSWWLGGRTYQVIDAGGLLEVFSRSAQAGLVGLPTTARVVVNDGPPLGNGWPELRHGTTQALSMVGLDAPLFDTIGVAAPLRAAVSPEPGVLDRPTRLAISIVGGAGQSPVIRVIEGGVTRTFAAASASVTLGVGRHELTIEVERGGALATLQGTWRVVAPTDALTDSDGDGVSDLIEAELHTDPLVPDAALDADGDGWSNLDEALRGCPPDAIDATAMPDYPACDCVLRGAAVLCAPRDGDGDGWSDWDEAWRGTDDANAQSYPVARDLYEPEATLIVSTAVAGFGASGALEVSDVRGAGLPARGATGLGLVYALNAAPSAGAPAIALAGDTVARVPAGLPVVARLRSWSGASPVAGPVALSAVTPGLAPLDGTRLIPALRAAGLAPTTLAGLRVNAATLFATQLRATRELALDARSTALVTELAGLAAWHAGPDKGPWVVLGPVPNTTAQVLAPAMDALAGAYLEGRRDWAQRLGTGAAVFQETPGEALNALVGELDLLLTRPATAPFVASATALLGVALAQPSLGDGAAEAFDLELARQLQLTDAHVVARTAARLVAYRASGIAALTEPQRASLEVPTGDFDGDGRSQAAELAGPAATSTDPTLADTDGDGDPDATDPCPTDALDRCWPGLAAAADRDGDGITDGVDNCPNAANGWIYGPDGLVDANAPAAQLDGDGDGVGDACEGLATIVSPRSHTNVAAGTTMTFRAAATGAVALADLALTWDFGGVAPSASGATATVTFASAGTFTVTLTATRAGGAETGTDVRIIGVRGATAPAPEVTLTAPTGAVEGQALAFAAAATQGPNAIAWTFGDGGTATGAAPTHAYATQGSYLVTATATNLAGQQGTAQATVVVADSAPAVSGEWLATGRDLEVGLTDTSTAHDGIAAVTWQVLEVAGLGASGPDAALVLPRPGTYTVRQTVTDGDGSVASVDHTVAITGSGVELVRGFVDGTWRTVTFAHPMVDPVVIAGVPTALDEAPGVVQVRNVGPTGFEARFGEWDYLDGPHGSEVVPFLAIERGYHHRVDGTVWAAGTTPAADPGVAAQVTFAERLGQRPVVAATGQTVAGVTPYVLRVAEPTRRAFEVTAFEEEAAAATARPTETVGWLAVFAPSADGSMTVDGVPADWTTFGARLNHQWRRRGDFVLALAEETSADPEVVHPFETAQLIVIDGELFGGTVSLDDLDPYTVRRAE